MMTNAFLLFYLTLLAIVTNKVAVCEGGVCEDCAIELLESALCVRPVK